MKILLDACSFLWAVLQPDRLTQKARNAFESPENDVYLSAVSAWEITLRHGLGQLELPSQPSRFIPEARERHGISAVGLEERATLVLPDLPKHHKDPFDRMLVCQAMAEGFIILTPDRLIRQYDVRTLW